MAQARTNPWLVLVVLTSGFFMILLDTTIVNVAIPAMSAGLNTTLDQILWVLNAYILVYAVLLITAGRLGDLYGQRNLFAVGLFIFTVASALCGFSQNATELILARILQGVGGAILTPQTLAILTTVFPPERRGAAFGIWGGVAGVATIAGPTLGGLLVSAFDWRYIFFINVPIGALVIVMSFFLIPDVRVGARHRLDIPGVLLATVALLAICYGLVEGQRYNWGHITSFISIPLVIGVGIVLLAVFLLVQARTQHREPLVPFALFRDRNFSLMNWVSGVLSVGMMGIFLPFTIYLQSALGFSALKAGLTLAPASVVSMFVAPVAGRLTDRIGGKYILFSGLMLFAIGFGLTAVIATTQSTWQDFIATLAIAGVGMGCKFAPMTAIAIRNIEPRVAGAASGMINTVRQVGAVIGTAAVGALLQNRLAVSLPAAAAERAGSLPPQARGHFIAGFAKSAQHGAAANPSQGNVKLPNGTPASLAGEIHKLAGEVFSAGYVTAMHATMIAPIALLVIASLSCLGIKRRARPTQPAADAAAGSAGLPEASQAPA